MMAFVRNVAAERMADNFQSALATRG